MVDGDGFEPP